MFVRSGFLAAALLAGLGLAAAPARAQIIYGQPAQGEIDLVYAHWKLTLDEDEVTIDQFAVPVTAFLPLRENLEARVYVAQSNTTVSQLGQDFELNGLTDLRLQVNQSLAGDQVLLGLGVNLPTGKKGLSLDEEWVVMNYLSQTFLSFPVRRLGGGFGLNATLGGAKEVGDYRLGLTAGYDLAGAYEAYLDQGDYKPGNAFAVTLGAQREFGTRLLNADLTFTTSSDDKLDDTPVFSRGDELAFHAGLAGKAGAKGYRGDAYYRLRGRNTVYDPDGILLQQLKIYGNEFLLGGALDFHGAAGWAWGPRADLRLIAGNEFGFGSTSVVGLGGQVARALTPHLNLTLNLKYFTGSTHGGEIDLTGYQAWVAAGGTF
ncbi:MAG: hypothetical protein IH621_16720 [Krumholzibacteria bacterium]|nr:hypothetical protein [Candidatus Krumholzibacteria bacterium]